LPFHPILRCGRLFALHYQGAPNGKLVELTDEGYESSVIIPEQSTGILQLVIAGNTAYAEYLDRFVPSIRCWNFSGTERACIAAPTDGTVHLLPSRLSDERVVFYSHESFTQRPTIFEYEPGSALSKPWHHQAPVQDPQPTFIERNTYRSTDSKMVPITLVRKKTGAPAPVVMTSYGGFGVPSTPQFSVLATIMIELGATFALPHIRGGGEFGREWGQAGRGRNRQVSFDDFLSAAEWLRKEGITEPKRLAIFGGSNSGLLVGAAMTQKPHLFCAVLCISPLLDMVRYEFFDQAQRWKHEYGTVSDPDDFRALYAYSPYHHVDIRINYPSTLFVSGDRDDRCDPAHARKMAARLRQREAQRAPILIDYSDERGHSPTMPLSVRVEALTRRIGFLCRELHLPVSGLEPL
jgi:prolyl oligopeptidase